MKTCLECGTIYNRATILRDRELCPIENCQGQIADIDDEIFQSIRLLNLKGFSTEFSCSGHTWGGNPYIVFYGIVREKSFASFPKGFKAEIGLREQLILRYQIESENHLEILKEVLESSIALLEWAEMLPSSKFLDINFLFGTTVEATNIQKKISQELKLFNPHWKTIEDDLKVASYCILICPSLVKDFKKEIRSFAKVNKVKVSF